MPTRLSDSPRRTRRPTFHVECLEDRCVFSTTALPLSGTRVYLFSSEAAAAVGAQVSYEFSGQLLTVPTADTVGRTATVVFNDNLVTVGVFQPTADGQTTGIATTRAVDVPAVYTGEVRLTALADAADVKRYGFQLETSVVSSNAADGVQFDQLAYRAFATSTGGSSTGSPVVTVPPSSPPPPPATQIPPSPPPPPAAGNGNGEPLGPAAPPAEPPPLPFSPPPPPPPRNNGPALVGQSAFEAGTARTAVSATLTRPPTPEPPPADAINRAATTPPAGLTYQFLHAPTAATELPTEPVQHGVSLEAAAARRVSTPLPQSATRIDPLVPELHGVALADAVVPDLSDPVADVLTALAAEPIPAAPFAAAEPEPVETRSAQKGSNRTSYLFLAALLGVGTNHFYRRRTAAEKA
jgi:hypothetical protein